MSERYDNMVEDYERIIYERDKAYAKLQAELEYHKTLTAAQQRVAELEQYETLFNHALDCVDGVFQVCSTNPKPLLPDFLTPGSCKFEGVKKLAEAYIDERATNARLRELLRRWVAEFPYAEVILHDTELKRDSEKELGQ